MELVHVPNAAKNIPALNESVLPEMFIFSVQMGQSFQENVTPFVAGKEADQEQEQPQKSCIYIPLALWSCSIIKYVSLGTVLHEWEGSGFYQTQFLACGSHEVKLGESVCLHLEFLPSGRAQGRSGRVGFGSQLCSWEHWGKKHWGFFSMPQTFPPFPCVGQSITISSLPLLG